MIEPDESDDTSRVGRESTVTWTAPMPDRVEPPFVADERTALVGWLEYHRATLLTKCAGLTPDQLRLRSTEPSSISLLGLVRHMADVERNWFRRRLEGEDIGPLFFTAEDGDADFNDVDTANAEADFAAYLAELEVVRALATSHSLEDTFVHSRINETIDLRWVYVHMIEEYARHNGHADLIRERIDGATGD
jgi:uncharacterized damage-inducible protein DinB